jgi:hypothetical protein
MRKRVAIAIVSVTVSLVAAGGVLADSTTIQDPEGDATTNNLDIVSAKAGHAPGGVLKHRVTVAKKINPNDMGPNLHINVGGGSDSEFIVRPMASGVGPGPMKGGVFNPGGGKVASATITAVGENGLKYKFREKAIGKPGRYGWAWIVAAENGDVIDRAPDTGYVRHRP